MPIFTDLLSSPSEPVGPARSRIWPWSGGELYILTPSLCTPKHLETCTIYIHLYGLMIHHTFSSGTSISKVFKKKKKKNLGKVRKDEFHIIRPKSTPPAVGTWPSWWHLANHSNLGQLVFFSPSWLKNNDLFDGVWASPRTGEGSSWLLTSILAPLSP